MCLIRPRLPESTGRVVSPGLDDIRRDNTDNSPRDVPAAQVLTSYYCDKLEDHECVPSTLRGLVVLAKLPTFGAGEASQVFRSYVQLYQPIEQAWN